MAISENLCRCGHHWWSNNPYDECPECKTGATEVGVMSDTTIAQLGVLATRLDCMEKYVFAGTARKAIDELTAAKAEVERLRGRAAALELRAMDYLKAAPGLAEPKDRIKARMNLEDAINHCPDPKPFILRMQAEAVKAVALEIAIYCEDDPQELAENYAQRLRQQAEDAEKGGDDG